MSFFANEYDVIVVGAGHAGCEAALAVARMGCKTLIATLSLDNIALMPCNPSVGGPAKAHLVREIDALGGEMGVLADRTQIQIRMLNTAKGPAVHALRAQSDKHLYHTEMKKTLENQENLDVKQVLVEKIIVEDGKIKGVEGQTGAVYLAKAVVLTTGTYLGGRIIIGDVAYEGGPQGQQAAMKLTDSLISEGVEIIRFKTGTPPRVDARTVDYSRAAEQKGEEGNLAFSFMTEENVRPAVSCWLTYTTGETHQVIRDNLYRSPLFSGVIHGTGPRYCPSIEDKIVRFADKEKHQIFIEPEGMDTNEMYVQGFNTSLPEEVQLEMLRTLPGLEKAEIMRPGYAIEYDAVKASQLSLSFEIRKIPGLFCAGQINGTSGYEEAAGQGILAGINAALKVQGREPLVLKRSEAYLGVLIDDLILKETTEPYRLMTSRAEYRLLLRQDNADMRLTEKGREIGLVTEERYEKFLVFRKRTEQGLDRLKNTRVTPADEKTKKMLTEKNSALLKKPAYLSDLLKRPEIKLEDLKEAGIFPDFGDYRAEALMEQEIKYEGYIARQKQQVEKFEKMENRRIPAETDYEEIPHLRKETRQKLTAVRPLSIGQASRVQGVSPADISMILIYLENGAKAE